MDFRRFLIASTLGTLAWTALLAGAGFRMKSDFQQIERFVEPVADVILVVMILAYAWRLATHKAH
jgi:membrane protein DedA with SNARE-associated domain